MKTKKNSPFSSIQKFKGDKLIFFAFFSFIILPIIVISSLILREINLRVISSILSVFTYLIMFLFINSYIVLYETYRGKKFSFIIVLKLIPAIIPSIFLPSLFYAIAIVFAEYFFSIIPYIIFIILPIVSFVPLFNNTVILPEVINANNIYQKTTAGKNNLKTTISLSAIIIIATFIIRTVVLKQIIYYPNINNNYQIYIMVYTILAKLLTITGYFILYISIVNLYTKHTFNLPKSVLSYANSIFQDKKNVHSSRRSFKPKRNFKKKPLYQEDSFGFEKNNKQKKKQTKEHNRFTEDGGYNRFEDTKF